MPFLNIDIAYCSCVMYTVTLHFSVPVRVVIFIQVWHLSHSIKILRKLESEHSFLNISFLFFCHVTHLIILTLSRNIFLAVKVSSHEVVNFYLAYSVVSKVLQKCLSDSLQFHSMPNILVIQ